MRAVALHQDLLVATSAIWQTNCLMVRGGEEVFLIDSPVLPAELEALPALLEQAGFPTPSGLLATHGDWDHLLGRLAFPDLPLGCAQTTAERMRSAPGDAQRDLREFDHEFLIDRPRPLALGAVQALPVPGHCGLGDEELELHATDGHTGDGMAIWNPRLRALVVGDYLSAVEIPSLAAERGALDAYLATLECLRPLVAGAEHVISGHGPILDGERALTVLAEDEAYLRALDERGCEAELPPTRRTRAQRVRHAQNADRLLPGSA